MKKVILACVVAIMLIIPIKNSALGIVVSQESNTTPQCQLVQQAFMIELYPKIRSILSERYHTDFSFGNHRVLPILNSNYLVPEFKIEGIVTKGNISETIQITFRTDLTNGSYRAVGLNVVSRQPSK